MQLGSALSQATDAAFALNIGHFEDINSRVKLES